MKNVDLVLYRGTFIFHRRGTLTSVMLETEPEKYSALSFKNVLRSCCVVSDGDHNDAPEVVMGKAAAQCFFSFCWCWHENGLTISLSCCPVHQVPAVAFPA